MEVVNMEIVNSLYQFFGFSGFAELSTLPESLKNKIRYVNYKYEIITFEPRPDEKYLHHKYFKRLFETKEEAEFSKEFQNITREETLDLPLFDNLPENFDISFVRFDKEMDCWVIYELYVEFNEICILFRDITEEASDCIFREPLTKDNYIKACKIARKLFLGESVDEI